MTDCQAREIAEQFIARQHTDARYDYVGVVRVPRFSGELNVNFAVTSIEGRSFDGPVIVVVSELSGTARFCDSL
jgi:hypothetical protein